MALPHIRDQSFHLIAILLVFGTEMVDQKYLLQSGFVTPRTDNECCRDETSQLPDYKSSPCCSEHESGIDRMPHDSVRPSLHQFVLLFETDECVPVSAQVITCPKRKRETNERKPETCDDKKFGRRDNVPRERSPKTARKEKEPGDADKPNRNP